MAQQLDLLDNSLHNLIGGIRNGRKIEKLKNKSIDYANLRILSGELDARLHDNEFIKKNLLLLGENYEHNTDDGLLRIDGWNDDNYLIETGNLVGYVATKQFKINILSRFGDEFLKYLLCDAEGFLEVPDSGTIEKNGFIDWIMIFLWKNALKRAYRLGIPKQYISRHEKLCSVKGNVDALNYSIYKGLDGKVLCDYYQYDYNNPVTQLIAYTFSKIEKKALIQDCIQLKNSFEACTEGKKTSLSACLDTRSISNPYYSAYNQVISLSKNILRKRFGDISNSSDISSAFLFDMSMLFEHYIRKLLKCNDLNLFPKNEDTMTISRGLGKNDDRHLYPDIVIDKGNNEIEVYDVKYKHFNPKYGVKREDLFQLHTYVLYLSNMYTITKCGIIYPKKEEDESISDTDNIIRHPNYKKNIDGIPFRVIFFNIPNEDMSMANYKSLMTEKEKAFVEAINPLKKH